MNILVTGAQNQARPGTPAAVQDACIATVMHCHPDESQSATLMHRLQATWRHRILPPGDGL